MKQLDELLDKQPTKRSVIDIAELRNRNLLAFSELQHFNDTGTFLFKHPLIVNRSEHAELKRLCVNDPLEFLRKYKNCSDNIRRYESFLKRADRVDKKSKDKENLRRFRDKEAIFKSILEETKNKDE